jgi:hypothetical protein
LKSFDRFGTRVLFCSLVGAWHISTAAIPAPGEETATVQTTTNEFAAALERIAQITKQAQGKTVSQLHSMLDQQVWDDLNTLVEHWEDPRVEPLLQTLANAGPQHIGDLGNTLTGQAQDSLLQVQANQIRRDLLTGKDDTAAKLTAIRQFLQQHPDLLSPETRPLDKFFLVRTLVGEAMESSGANAMDLAVKSGFVSMGGYAKKYSSQLVEYARRIGLKESFAAPYLLDRIKETGDSGFAPLLDDWVKDDTKGEHAGVLVGFRAGLPGGKNRLLELLNDSRSSVVREAVVWLRHSFPDEESKDAIRALRLRREQSGAEASELSFYSAVIQQIEQEIAGRKSGR